MKYLPYDVSVLYEVMNTDGATSMAFCCRCHDEVSSFSWCFTCLSPLCEFHHQDHRLSIDTRFHEIKTFQEILKCKELVRSVLPPMACPESLGYDCSLFCKTCGHMISAQAMVEFHKGHNVVDLVTIYEQSNEMLESSSSIIQNCIGELMLTFDVTKTAVSKLERNVESVQTRIHELFDMLRSVLSKRENALMEKVKEYLEINQSRLFTKLDKITDYLDACRLINLKVDKLLSLNREIAGKIDIPFSCETEDQHALRDNMSSDVGKSSRREIQGDQDVSRNNLRHTRSYVISSAKVITDRCDYVRDECESLFTPFPDNRVKCSPNDLEFLIKDRETKELCNMMETVGNIRNNLDDKVKLHIFDSRVPEVGPSEKDFENVYKFSVESNPPLADEPADIEKNHSKCLIVEMKSSKINLDSSHLNESSFFTVAKMTIEVDMDRLLLPDYEISSFVENDICADGPPHLTIKILVKKN